MSCILTMSFCPLQRLRIFSRLTRENQSTTVGGGLQLREFVFSRMALIKERPSGCIHIAHQEIMSGIQNQDNSVLKPRAGSIFIRDRQLKYNKGCLERKITIEAKHPSFSWWLPLIRQTQISEYHQNSFLKLKTSTSRAVHFLSLQELKSVLAYLDVYPWHLHMFSNGQKKF